MNVAMSAKIKHGNTVTATGDYELALTKRLHQNMLILCLTDEMFGFALFIQYVQLLSNLRPLKEIVYVPKDLRRLSQPERLSVYSACIERKLTCVIYYIMCVRAYVCLCVCVFVFECVCVCESELLI